VTWRVPLGDGAVPHVALEDCGYYARWLFDNPERANGMNLPSGAAVEGCLSPQLATLRMSRSGNDKDKLTPGMPVGSLEVVQLRKTTQAPPRRKIFSHIALAALRDGAGARIR
jgi:hypothetical protein